MLIYVNVFIIMLTINMYMVYDGEEELFIILGNDHLTSRGGVMFFF
jgi:hypothetical protein